MNDYLSDVTIAQQLHIECFAGDGAKRSDNAGIEVEVVATPRSNGAECLVDAFFNPAKLAKRKGHIAGDPVFLTQIRAALAALGFPLGHARLCRCCRAGRSPCRLRGRQRLRGGRPEAARAHKRRSGLAGGRRRRRRLSKQSPIDMSVPGATAVASRQPRRIAMRHLLSDWRQWSVTERIVAVAMAVAAVMIPAALATV